MPVGNLNIYDILVDLIPGTTLVGIFVVYIQPTGISPGEGLIILIIGYVVGRIVHGFVSLQQMDTIRVGFEELLFREYIDDHRYGFSFRNRVLAVYEDDADADFQGYDENELEPTIIKETIDALISDIDSEIDISDFDLKSHDEVADSETTELSDNILSLRYYGENLLYGKNYLYHKYEMLATFYRSMWLVGLTGALFSFVVFISTLVISCLGTGPILAPGPSLENLKISLILCPVSLFISYISLHQRLKFRFRKTRAFITDLYTELEMQPDSS